MTRAIALIPDLLFGSNVLGMMRAAEIDVELVSDPAALTRLLAAAGAGAGAEAGPDAGARPDVLIVDLTGELDGSALVRSLATAGSLAAVKTLGFYSHVDAAMRERAQDAGFDLVVPRSRMAREGAALVAQLAGE